MPSDFLGQFITIHLPSEEKDEEKCPLRNAEAFSSLLKILSFDPLPSVCLSKIRRRI
jgi:hypothetical protein